MQYVAEKEKKGGKFDLWVVCHDEAHRRGLVKLLRKAYPFLFNVVDFSKMDVLPRGDTSKVAAIVFSLVGKKADVKWEIGEIYCRWFSDIPLIIQIAPYTTQEEALRYVLKYGVWTVFGTEDDVVSVIENSIGPFRDDQEISETTKINSVSEKVTLT